MTQALNNAFGQRQVSTIYNALNQYRVVMEVAPEFAQGPEALDRLYVMPTASASRCRRSARYEHTDGPGPRQPHRAVRVDVNRRSS